ncbi:Kelch repeat-containing protein [Sparassis crispa]|uniref:Kelch repeat-containing protein n=1 Tax=Sparassis crispa TaxID=139825 RepID=A0A401GP28_9APHY|nr:Kelch repeat-containing protein [Sparassis crispa]GBE83977.1 Kelch repeat-containing protein [Sparassis crispa]
MRANATLTPCPNGNHLWCIGGEFFSDDGKAHFYNDVFRYSPEKDEWRKFVSPTCPGPRSAHAVVGSPAGGGKLFLFGGEFSSLYQNTFHHYRDFWCFDITTHTWERIDTKVRPSARSGHRMAMWKNYVVLFGGFYDPGLRTNYLNDLWLFDAQEYKWRQVEFRDAERKPSPRSGFSFLSTADGILLHGGYCKEYSKGKRPIGVMLDDTWFLRMTLATETEGKAPAEPLSMKWERRKRPSAAFAPSLRSGCTMALWSTKNTGILFGGVTDEDTSEETLDSVFHNDLFGYQIAGNGRWISMMLKKTKKKGVGGPKKQKPAAVPARPIEERYEPADFEFEEHSEEDDKRKASTEQANATVDITPGPEMDPDDPNLTTPLPRYNAMLAVLRNTLYIYGGIFERGSREYTLDDFYALQLDKLDCYTCLKPSGILISAEGDDESSDDDEDDEDDENDEGEDDEEDEAEAETEEQRKGTETLQSPEGDRITVIEEAEALEIGAAEKDALRSQATAFMGVAKDTKRSAEDIISTPLPGEILAMFYARSREYWAQKAHESSDNRGKMLRRDGFVLAGERYAVYKPVLTEVEKILAEAGLDEEEMKRGAAAGPSGPSEQSRNRR